MYIYICIYIYIYIYIYVYVYMFMIASGWQVQYHVCFSHGRLSLAYKYESMGASGRTYWTAQGRE